MAKNRPADEETKSDDEVGGTQQLRIHGDLRKMIREICWVTGQKSAELVDAILRPEIELLHRKHRTTIDNIRKARGKE